MSLIDVLKRNYLDNIFCGLNDYTHSVKGIEESLSLIPSGWTIKKFGDLNLISTGIKQFDGEKKYYSTGTINTLIPEGIYTFGNKPSRANRDANLGDVIEARMMNTSKATIIDSNLEGSLLSTGFFQIGKNENYIQKYIYYYLQSNIFIKQKDKLCTGATQKSINDKNLQEILIPMPNIEEQENIVQRIESLFELLDKKEKNDKDKSNLKIRLKEKIYDNSIHGQLVKNDSNLKPISVSSLNNNVPFEIPANWVWTYLKNISDYGNNKKKNGKDILDDEWILELEDIEKDTGKIIKKVLQKERKAVSDKNIFKENDVLYGKLRPYLNKCVIAHESGYCSTEIEPITLIDSVLPEYLHVVLTSKYFLNYVNSCSYGAKMPRLGTKDGQNAMIPLPPFEEQKRIVEKIESLFELIEQL